MTALMEASVSASESRAPFLTTNNDVFSIQYRNSTSEAITVWLNWSQPPCSKTEAQALKCDTKDWLPANAESKWKALASAFKASGTVFQIIKGKSVTTVDVSNRIDLDAGSTFRIVPPISNGNPEWYWSTYDANAKKHNVTTAGVSGWVTKKGKSMPATMQTTLYEYNLVPNAIWWDISAVNGLNTKVTMALEGKGCSSANCGCGSAPMKQCRANIAAYMSTNNGCPYIMKFDEVNTCPNPNFYSSVDSNAAKAPWVVATSSFTTQKVSNEHSDIWKAAGRPSGADMASAASGLPKMKEAYHIWWATNPVGQAWLSYLQKNPAGECNAYGWAYDEKRWKPGDKFDSNGNPPNNTAVKALMQCGFSSDTYLNIDILEVM